MPGAISNALSGAVAAARREEVAASNIANLRSRGAPRNSTDTTAADGTPLFRPGQVAETSTLPGGVRATVVAVDPTSIQQFEPDSPDANAEGVVDRPNVDLAQEQSNQLRAQRAFEANLKVIRTADDLLKAVVDIKS
ncbi:MAG: flagellar biosynthesis protein FlgG [Alphaproteobacteria bacterium]|nr:flagellar biosynthesis protein FlgG [Alphaproteobacteria bacterium]